MQNHDELDYLKWRVDRLEGDTSRALNRLSSHGRVVNAVKAILASIPNSADIANTLDMSDKELRSELAQVTAELQEARLAYETAFKLGRK